MTVTLGLMAIFRNEADVLEEFIEHHIRQGVDHFYLIDNMSEDDFETVIKKYDNITIFEEPHVANKNVFSEVGPQTKAYNKFLNLVKTDWLYICDLDEYIYGPTGYTLKSYIEEHGSNFDQLLISSKTFTSNNLKKQPESVISYFTERFEYEPFSYTNGCIKVNKAESLDITAHILFDGITTNPKQTIRSDKLCVEYKKEHFHCLKLFRERKTDPIHDDPLVINHYSFMSEERYFKVKPTRGNASWEPHKGKPLYEFYKEKWDIAHNKKLCQDHELKEITEK